MSAGGVTDRWPLVARAGELAGFATVFADPHRRGVLIFGPAGVGKTRLADEFLGMAAAAGYSCGRAAGSSTASEIPLGALAHLLPAAVGRERLDAVTLFTSVAREIRTRIPD